MTKIHSFSLKIEITEIFKDGEIGLGEIPVMKVGYICFDLDDLTETIDKIMKDTKVYIKKYYENIKAINKNLRI